MPDSPIEHWIKEWGTNLDWEAKQELRKTIEANYVQQPNCLTCRNSLILCDYNEKNIEIDGTFTCKYQQKEKDR